MPACLPASSPLRKTEATHPFGLERICPNEGGPPSLNFRVRAPRRFGCLMVLTRREASKDAELLVLRGLDVDAQLRPT